jgi:hypothetical protein
LLKINSKSSLLMHQAMKLFKNKCKNAYRFRKVLFFLTKARSMISLNKLFKMSSTSTNKESFRIIEWETKWKLMCNKSQIMMMVLLETVKTSINSMFKSLGPTKSNKILLRFPVLLMSILKYKWENCCIHLRQSHIDAKNLTKFNLESKIS